MARVSEGWPVAGDGFAAGPRVGAAQPSWNKAG
jgi:hypothetical protein